MSDLSKKEQLYDLIRANPFISQQDLAGQLRLSRSAVAGYIAGLIRERRLLGRAYVLPDRRPIACIGAANLDRKLRALAPLAMGSSNPARQGESFGGVARNIAENLARLGAPVTLTTATGDDASGRALLAHAEAAGIDTTSSLRIAGACSGTYTAVLDEHGEMVVALADMALYAAITPEFLVAQQEHRVVPALIVADLNLPRASLAMLIAAARRDANPLVLVAVSQPKMAHLPDDLRGVRLLILNEGELASRIGAPLRGEADVAAACATLQAQGVVDVVVTRGAAGVLYTRPNAKLNTTPNAKPNANTKDAQYDAQPDTQANADRTCETGGIGRLAALAARVVDVTGAGDAFSAALCWSLFNGSDDLALACRRGVQLAAMTIACAETVCPSLDAGSLDTLHAAPAPPSQACDDHPGTSQPFNALYQE